MATLPSGTGVGCNSEQVIQLIMQFMVENNLNESLQALQQETNVSLNTVESVEQFISDIQQGNWDGVLKTTQRLQLPPEKLIALFDQIVLEMLELREVDLARSMLRETKAMDLLRQTNPQRYMKLDAMCSSPSFEPRSAYPDGSNKEKRRLKLSQTLAAEVSVVPASRLLSLLNQALKWQAYIGELPEGQRYDLFRGQAPQEIDTTERPPQDKVGEIKIGVKAHAEVVKFSPNGSYFVSGSTDGFLELWDPKTSKHRRDLIYQKDERFMMHDSPILCIAFSKDSQMICAGSNDGQLRVWKIATGVCVRKIDKAHAEGITACAWSREPTQILTGGYDTLVRIHGVKSGKMLKEFSGHKAFINDVAYPLEASHHVVSCSADGTVRFWDTKTMNAIATFQTPNPNPNLDIPVLKIVAMRNDQLLVCPRAPTLYVLNMNGKVMKILNSGKRAGGDFKCCCASPQGEYIYAAAEDNMLYVFTAADGKLDQLINLEGKEAVGVSHHPHRNMIAACDTDGAIRFFANKGAI